MARVYKLNKGGFADLRFWGAMDAYVQTKNAECLVRILRDSKYRPRRHDMDLLADFFDGKLKKKRGAPRRTATAYMDAEIRVAIDEAINRGEIPKKNVPPQMRLRKGDKKMLADDEANRVAVGIRYKKETARAKGALYGRAEEITTNAIGGRSDAFKAKVESRLKNPNRRKRKVPR